MRRLTLLATSATIIALASPAFAAQIAAGSQISITGGVVPIGGPGVWAAFGLDFLNMGNAGTPNGTLTLNAAPTGDFSVLTLAGCPLSASAGGCGVIQDLPNFAAFAPISGFFTVTEGPTTLTFNLDDLSVDSRIPPGGSNIGTLAISGMGSFILPGFDPTPGMWTLTAQGPGTTTFSATALAAPTAVPEPNAMLLLGGSLALAGMVRRRRD